jgi:hypothetical protein
MNDIDHAEGWVTRLAAIPERMARAVAGWSEDELRTTPAEGGWTAAEILAHVRASDDIMTPRMYMVLVRDRPPLPAYDDRKWAQVAGYARTGFRESLTPFALRRAEVVAVLRRARPDDWKRSGVHEEHGATSLLELVRKLVEHEEEHCAQLESMRPRGA